MPEGQTESLNSFNVTEVSAAVRSLAKNALNTETLADAITKLLYDSLLTEQEQTKACALVRFFRTVDFQQLEPTLQKQVTDMTGRRSDTDKCLTLLGTSGQENDWNSRKDSRGHAVIPLLSPEMVAESPMLARLITQLGIEISSLFDKERTHKLKFTDPKDRDYNIFYVQEARNSPFIPAQNEFVLPHSIRSVIGFGSLLPSGDLYAVMLFFRVLIPETMLKQFTMLALSTTIAVLSIPEHHLFND